MPDPPLGIAPSCTLSPLHVRLSEASANTLNAFPVTVTVTLSLAVQPVVSDVAVRVKIVDKVKLEVKVEILVEEITRSEGVHK